MSPGDDAQAPLPPDQSHLASGSGGEAGPADTTEAEAALRATLLNVLIAIN